MCLRLAYFVLKFFSSSLGGLISAFLANDVVHCSYVPNLETSKLQTRTSALIVFFTTLAVGLIFPTVLPGHPIESISITFLSSVSECLWGEFHLNSFFSSQNWV